MRAVLFLLVGIVGFLAHGSSHAYRIPDEGVKRLSACDVIVCGGGPAGIGASIAAARHGLKTLLIELNGCVGGTSTAGALPFMLGAYTGSIPYKQMLKKGLAYRDLPRTRRAVRGIFDELCGKIVAEGGASGIAKMGQTAKYPGLDRFGCHDEFTFDMEVGKRVFEREILAAGAEIRYYARVLDVKRTGERVEGVYFADKSGIQYVPAKVVIDCTGDADVVAAAGFATYKGDRVTGEMCASGLVAHLENVDSAAVEAYLNAGGDPWYYDQLAKALAENPEWKEIGNISHFIIFPMVQEGVFMVNGGTSIAGYDGTDGKSMSDFTVVARNRDRIVCEIFRRYVPGFANCRLRQTAQYPGVRETRRIVAERQLTPEDLLEGTKFDDIVALAGRHFDLARQKGGQVFADRGKRVKGGVAAIPFHAMIPKGADNLIAAGRCIGADGQALGPVRIMSTCMALGEAAGTAAKFKIESGVPFRDVDVAALRADLKRNNCEVDP